jgi:hypothetical protein
LKHRKIGVIPDVQAKDGVPLEHLAWAGQYFADKQPDDIVCLGDFADMPSLRDDDRGRKSYEGRRYIKDVEAARKGMDLLVSPIRKARGYRPRLTLTLGNHEHRINRAQDGDPKLEGTFSLKDLSYEDYGWKVFPFLEVINIGGVHFSHYFPSGVMGRPCTTARKIINTYHVSAVAGHQQGREVAYAKRGDGNNITAIIAGSFYQHDEDYLTPMANKCWRGIIMLHEVQDGQYDEMFVSLNYLRSKFGK